MDLSGWLEIKRLMAATTALERDALHIYAGVAVQLLTAALLKWRLREWRTLLPVLIVELANEAVDFAHDPWLADARTSQYLAAVHDVVNTLALPVVILLIARGLDRGSD